MKGIIFTEFLELVEREFGLEVADRILDETELKSGGAYTSVGTYDYQELLVLVTKLSEVVDVNVPTLVESFGEVLFEKLANQHASMTEGPGNAFEFLESVENKIHVEVLKLYPDAQLPSFESKMDSDRLELTYKSSRPFAKLAEGLIKGCIKHFDESINVEMKAQDSGTHSQFVLTKKNDSGP